MKRYNKSCKLTRKKRSSRDTLSSVATGNVTVTDRADSAFARDPSPVRDLSLIYRRNGMHDVIFFVHGQNVPIQARARENRQCNETRFLNHCLELFHARRDLHC